jgi:hypothetical protein
MSTERYLPAPDLALSDEQRRAFEMLYREAVLPANGREVVYALPHPKWQFLQWLVDEHDVILHGSNEMAINDFKPSRNGFDANPHGNHRAIYATNDGIWPMFFAVLDKPNYQGSMRNGVMWTDADHNEVDFDARRLPAGALKWYQFSLNQDEIHKRPWREGMIYILPRRTFEQLRDRNGVLIAEWASREPVKPLAMLRVEPADFPYVDRVNGHDDTQIVRTQVLMKLLIESASEVEELGDGFRFSYPADESRRDEAIEFGECLRSFMDAARITVTDEPGGLLRLAVQGPDALKDALAKRIQMSREMREGVNDHGKQ